MNVNFFSWLRDGVRQSVLLGVSDAIETLGTPAEEDQLHPGVAALLRDGNQESSSEPKRVGGSSTRGRKRLGKSLKELDTATK